MKYINAEKLKAEIERRKQVYFDDYFIKKSGNPADYGASNALAQVLSFIDSLQEEQPGLPGIEENMVPGKDYIPVEWVDACEEYGKWEIVKKEQSEGIEGVVHHYANVHYIITNKEQLNARLKDFEERAEVRVFINAKKGGRQMRIEIDIRDNIPPETALEAVKVVVKAGRISKGEKGKMYYCWLSTFSTDIGEICVSIRQYRKNDCFVVYKGKNQ